MNTATSAWAAAAMAHVVMSMQVRAMAGYFRVAVSQCIAAAVDMHWRA